MPAVKITNKPVSTPGDQTHFLVTQPELPEGYAPTGQETEEELAELKVESLREIEMDDMVELFQSKFAFDSEPTAESGKPVTSAGIKAALDSVDTEIGELKENLNYIRNPEITEGIYRVEYVESNGTQYVNLEANFKPTTGFEIDFIVYNELLSSGDYGNIFGSRVASSNQDLELTTFTSDNTSNKGYFRYGTSKTDNGKLIVGKRQKVSWINGIYTVDGDAKTLVTNITADNGYPIYLFALNNAGSVAKPATMRLYNFKLYDGDTLIRDMLPCQKLDGTVGLYDTVNDIFYPNLGTGSFTFESYQNKQTVDILDALSENIFPPLAPYLEVEAQDCADKIRSECDEQSIVIGFVTDSHYPLGNNYDNTVATIKRVNELCPFDFVIHGGDLVHGNIARSKSLEHIQACKKTLDLTAKRVFVLTGNHDNNLTYYKYNGNGYITRGDRYSTYAKHNYTYQMDDASNSFYFDIPSCNVRVICLDSVHEDSYYLTDGYSRWGFTADEVAWTRDVALNTTKQVAFFCHIPVTGSFDYGNVDPIRGTSMRNVVENYISNGGTVIGWFHGHTHWDFIGKYSSENGFNEVSTGCAKGLYNPNDFSNYVVDGAVIETNRTSGTINQELWDIIIIKPNSRTVNMIRFGAGNDRGFIY